MAEDGKYDPTTSVRRARRARFGCALAGTQKRSRQRLPPSARPLATCSPSILTLTTPTSRTFPELTTGLRISKSTKGARLALSAAKRATSRRAGFDNSKALLSDPAWLASPLLEKRGPMPNQKPEKTGIENRKTESEAKLAQKHKPVSSEQFATFEQQKSSQDRWRSGCNQGPARRNRVDRPRDGVSNQQGEMDEARKRRADPHRQVQNR